MGAICQEEEGEPVRAQIRRPRVTATDQSGTMGRHRRRMAVGSADEIVRDAELAWRLRRGDEVAFVELVGRHHAAMVRLALSYVRSSAVAEDVVQETWLAALGGLSNFEGRSSMKTWLYRILINRARSAGAREQRQIPIGVLDRAVDAARFDRDGCWSSPPLHWVDEVEDRVCAEKLLSSIRVAIAGLPAGQRDVITLRDVDGVSAPEACEILQISHGHQRVLLHRARSRVRNALESEFGEVPA
jgi:RNA polymerase sigma-70 factor (ECF subfamily)